jgi:phosphoglycerate-specific signal transduction histidine kinase
MMPSPQLSPPLVAAAIAQLLDEQRAVLAELQDEPFAWLSLQAVLVRERIDWLEEELAMRLPPDPG